MSTGINSDKISGLRVDLLSYIESLNALSARLDSCKTSIQANMFGAGKVEIINKLNSIIRQMPKVNANINTYIITLGSVVKSYKQQDEDLSTELVHNIGKLGS